MPLLDEEEPDRARKTGSICNIRCLQQEAEVTPREPNPIERIRLLAKQRSFEQHAEAAAMKDSQPEEAAEPKPVPIAKNAGPYRSKPLLDEKEPDRNS